MAFNEAVAAQVLFGETTRQAAAASASKDLFPTMPTTTTGDVQQRQAAPQPVIDPAKVMFPSMAQADAEVDEQEPAAADEQQEAQVPTFTVPEGKAYDPEVMTTFGNVVGELGIAHDQAQVLLDKVAPVLEARQQAAVAQVHAAWAEETKADPEVGGARLDHHIAGAKAVLRDFGTPALNEMLAGGLGNNVEIVRLLSRLHRALDLAGRA